MKIQTSIQVENLFYHEAKKVFSEFGLTFGDAVNMFLAKVSMEQAIPFELSLPSNELINRKNNLDVDKNTHIYETSSQLFEDLGI
jgi:DNA-damage-inducible protein J